MNRLIEKHSKILLRIPIIGFIVMTFYQKETNKELNKLPVDLAIIIAISNVVFTFFAMLIVIEILYYWSKHL